MAPCSGYFSTSVPTSLLGDDCLTANPWPRHDCQLCLLHLCWLYSLGTDHIGNHFPQILCCYILSLMHFCCGNVFWLQLHRNGCLFWLACHSIKHINFMLRMWSMFNCLETYPGPGSVITKNFLSSWLSIVCLWRIVPFSILVTIFSWFYSRCIFKLFFCMFFNFD